MKKKGRGCQANIHSQKSCDAVIQLTFPDVAFKYLSCCDAQTGSTGVQETRSRVAGVCWLLDLVFL